MAEDPIFLQMGISHYGAMLKLNLDEEDRATVTRLLAEAEIELTKAKVVTKDFKASILVHLF